MGGVEIALFVVVSDFGAATKLATSLMDAVVGDIRFKLLIILLQYISKGSTEPAIRLSNAPKLLLKLIDGALLILTTNIFLHGGACGRTTQGLYHAIW